MIDFDLKIYLYLEKYLVPELKTMFMLADHDKFIQYNSNCCRQVAVACKAILDEAWSHCDWELRDWIFKSKSYNAIYNHAFVVGIDKVNKKKLWLCDMERQPYWNNYFGPIYNIEKPYKKIPSLCDEKKIEDITDDLSYKMCMTQDREFYTGMLGKNVIITALENIIRKSDDDNVKEYTDKLLNRIIKKWGGKNV